MRSQWFIIMVAILVSPTIFIHAQEEDVPSSLTDPWVRPADDMTMIAVPGGTFRMGSTDAEIEAAFLACAEGSAETGYCRRQSRNEWPLHTVTLDPFWLDRTEVTNAQYARCVDDGACQESHLAHNPLYNEPDYPATGIPWQAAADYCAWAGARLPTEAEWEYAARGPDRLVYPWGNEFDCTGGNLGDDLTGCDDGYTHTAPVGQFPAGASWVGALDITGNVWEWVADVFGDYPAEPQINPTGPLDGDSRILRGGSWAYAQGGARAAYRYPVPPDANYSGVGFRCAMSFTSEHES